VHELQSYSNCNLNLRPEWPSYGGELRRQGVHTVYLGKTDVYAPGAELGFSEMILPLERPLPGDTNHGRRPLSVRPDGAERAFMFGPAEAVFPLDVQVTDAALEWLGSTAPRLDRPWAMTVNLCKPHFPHHVTQDLWDLYPQGADLPDYGPEHPSAQHEYARDLRTHFQTDAFTEEQIRGLRRGYLGCVTFMDRQVGRLLAALERSGVLAETDVIYTSDHGEMLGKFGMWWKCSLYEDSVRVPLIAAGPSFDRGSRVGTPVDLHDVRASLFSCTGVRNPEDWCGRALQEIPGHDPERVVFSEYHGHGTRSGAYLVRKGKWKLIFHMAAPHQLFDLERDPHECDNLYDLEPGVAAELEADLRLFCHPEHENERAHAFEEEQLASPAST
jgi:choline-sulfatase